MPLDINLFREHAGGDPAVVRESESRRRRSTAAVNAVVAHDERWRYLTGSLDKLRKERNELQKQVAGKKKSGEPCDDIVLKIKEMGDTIAKTEQEQASLKDSIDSLLKTIGNIVDDSVPVSENEIDNKIERRWGEGRSGEGLLPHHELLWRIGGFEPDRGVQVAGHRGYFLRDVCVLLNQALINYALTFLRQRQFCLLQPPYFMKKEVMEGAAQLEQFEEELYKVGDGSGNDSLFLIATSEQPLCGYHKGEWMDEKILPLRYGGVSTCFRKEAGAHGKDTWGIFRVHQFEKVEQFVLCEGDINVSRQIHDEMIASAEEFYQSLGLPYQVVNIVSGALNNAAIKKFDLEGWFPSQSSYRELVSCSNCTDYQSRALEIRSGIKKVDQREKKYVHMLNATLCATGRVLSCILETYQEDNGVRVPPALIPFMEGLDFLPFVRKPKFVLNMNVSVPASTEVKPVSNKVSVQFTPSPTASEAGSKDSIAKSSDSLKRPVYTSPAPVSCGNPCMLVRLGPHLPSLDELDNFLRFHSFAEGARPNITDKILFDSLPSNVSWASYPSISRWAHYMKNYHVDSSNLK